MIIYVVIIILSLFAYLFMKKKNYVFSEEHILITGGSSGIGLAIAIEAAKFGATVTIVARSQVKLDAAKEKIETYCKSNKKVLTFSADVSQNNVDFKHIIEETEILGGPITMLINCAGTSLSSRFEDTSLQDFTDMLNVNYLGSIKVTQAVLPFMKQRKHGRIVFISSLAGLVGLFGYTAYSGSKFAIVGLAEALQMEIKSYNISVTVSFPPDTDTPGFAEENKNKPIETSKISESGGLYSAKDVAVKTLHDALDNKFMSYVGFEGWMLSNLCSGATPTNSLFQLITEVFTMGLCRVAVFIYLLQCDATIKKCAEEKEKHKNK